MVGAGNPHHQHALDMLNGTYPDDNDDDEQIRRPPERQETIFTDESQSVYSVQLESPKFKDDYDYGGYPASVIDMPSYPDPRDDPPEPQLESRFTFEQQSPPPPPASFWDRFRGKGRPRVGWTQSLIAILRSSYLNALLIFVPVAWGVHFASTVSHPIQFAFCFLALIPLCKLLDFGGENLALYCGKDIGDLIVVTLNNAVEALLAIFLLTHCELKLLQSTVIGVVLLRLLLVPAVAFIVGGARVAAQELHPHLADLNQTLLTTGILTILLPAAFFAALNSSDATASGAESAVSDSVRGDLLKASRGLAVILLAVYLCSRIFLHNPPGAEHDKGLHEHKDAPAELKEMVEKMADEEPEVNPWACLILLVVVVGFMGVTAEFLVQSIEPMRQSHTFKDEWFGLFMLPFISFSAECITTIAYFVHCQVQHHFGESYLSPPKTLANARSIDLSIQFLIFWLPLLVLLAWATHKPLTLLFDLFEVVAVLSAAFLVNTVTQDAKTNWSEGAMMLALYSMIGLTAWFYPGQPAVATMAACESIQQQLATEGVPPGSTFTNISFGAFHATLDNNQITNFTEHLMNLKKLYDVLQAIEQGS